ncbi:MAG: hypothetical protein ACOCRX_08685 [Candidatus Woesearchaeota archaeon]
MIKKDNKNIQREKEVLEKIKTRLKPEEVYILFTLILTIQCYDEEIEEFIKEIENTRE